MHQYSYTKRDWITAICIAFLVLATGFGALKFRITEWGDDHSAYILEGIAIAEGTFKEQAKTNYIIHPAEITKEATDGKLVYVWGYPLLLSVIYKIAGFDKINFSNLFWYKIPVLTGFSMMAAVLYLFFRRRFSYPVSLLFSLMFCFTPSIFNFVDAVSPDLLCLSFSVLVFLLCEVYTGFLDKKWIQVLPAAAVYGASLWFTHELRLNGFTVCITTFFGHFFVILRNKLWKNRRDLFIILLPYIIAAAISFCTEFFIFAPATQNISDYSRTYSDVFTRHLNQQFTILSDYIQALFGIKFRPLPYIILFLAFTGIWKGIREDPHLIVFGAGTYILVAALPYAQGLRYLFNGLPIFLMLIGYGVQDLKKGFEALMKKTSLTIPVWLQIPGRTIPILFLTVCLFLNLIPRIKSDLSIQTQKELFYSSDPYSENAIEVYGYIRDSLPKDAVIAFQKPRALYLNTDRVSIKAGINGHEVWDADYYLYDKGQYNNVEPDNDRMKKIFENSGFILYQISPET